MDTNSNNRLTATTWGTLLIILILTVISVGIYAPIKDYAFKDDTQQYLESDNFVLTLTDLTRYLNQPEDQSYYHRFENLKNIKYYIGHVDADENKTKVISNISLISDDTNSKLRQEINNSQFYLQVKFDEKGNSTIESSQGNGFNKDFFINRLLSRSENGLEEYANLEIAYTIPKNIGQYDDIFTYEVKSYNLVQYMILILTIGAISILLLTVIAFAIPYSSQKRVSIIRVFNKMFLELKLLAWFPGLFLTFGILPTGYNPNRATDYVHIIYDANQYFYLIGIPVTFALSLLIYLSICYIKYVYNEGIKEGLIKNSFIGKAFFYAVDNIKKLSEQVIEIDMAKEYHKKFMMLLGINLLTLWIIASAGALGLILAIVYTIFLFKYFIKMLDKVRTLNFATKQLAQGNFDIVLEEDFGILNPISKNLSNIKDGFKVAVDKEVKSQNLKNELISNVSHDLKTPLTSIITYVDLLKNEDTTNETQREYIDVLDKKSHRLKVLIEDLFEASKASSGNVELYLEELDIVALLRQTLGELEETINNSSLDIKVNAPETKIICKLDGKRTYRVFENIMSNILKYSMPNSRVYIDVLENEKEVSFIFKNISAYEMNFDASEITERFTRGDESRTTEGSGLGLAIAKSLVELQNGSITITIDGDLFKLILSFNKSPGKPEGIDEADNSIAEA
ncbi:MAG: histidine kinase [Desulfitibacter sp. BRH_c19]|nr:MAG: histidine kinase [Desulfitibacter sp. BRH_c19]